MPSIFVLFFYRIGSDKYHNTTNKGLTPIPGHYSQATAVMKVWNVENRQNLVWFWLQVQKIKIRFVTHRHSSNRNVVPRKHLKQCTYIMHARSPSSSVGWSSVPGLKSPRGKNLPDHEWGPIINSLSSSSFHFLDMTEILLKRTCIANYPSIHNACAPSHAKFHGSIQKPGSLVGKALTC